MQATSKPSPTQELQSSANVNRESEETTEATSQKSQVEPSQRAQRKRTPSASRPHHLFTFGFYSALIIAAICLGMGFLYLYKFMESANGGIERLLDNATSQTLRPIPPAEANSASTRGAAESKSNTDGRLSSANTDSSPNQPDVKDTLSSETTSSEAAKPAEARAMPAGYLEVLINGRLVMARLALLSCGVSVGFAFGFLGFALFLLGIKGSIDTELEAEHYKVSFARLSPGLLLLLSSIILIGICVTHPTPFEYTTQTDESAEQASPSTQRRTLQQDNTNREATEEPLPPRVE